MTDTAADARTKVTGGPLVPALMFIALVVAVVGSLGAPLITEVADAFDVSLAAAQWTLTAPLLVGAIATPVLGRLGTGPRRRQVILATLATVVVGSFLTVVPPSFGWLLAGRVAQGAGLGLTALMMGVARDHLPERRSASTIALLSVASTIGIGVGYPLAGLLTDVSGLRAAYGLGLLITAIALATAWWAVPQPPPGRSVAVDVPGAALLGAGLLALLLAVSRTTLWSENPVLAGALPAAAAVLLAVWVRRERRCATPLVDLTLLRHPAVAGANVTMLLGGVGMYLLLTLVTRYVQTPEAVGYGFGVNVFVAGLVLVPFSALGFAGGKLVPPVRKRLEAATVLAIGGAVVLAALVVFALARERLWLAFAVMGLLGLGVGAFSAAMPGAILAATPPEETSSAMSFNQVVRSVGFSTGSALGGLVLSAHTSSGASFPTESGYTVAAWAGAASMAVTVVISLVLRRTAKARLP
ncbi:MFS transporter [Streptomyces hygroscopicus]|uniref:MFS transporter n=1 Tax=Streptomyces hygroscopicus TaxID=1912 RepID=UPI00082CA08E|nr:MFS transporter [Streptomyces hygroscopicus]GLV75507.1 MFS transporter [Streptomyces hygroscopicus subsp. hygroscopicus]